LQWPSHQGLQTCVADLNRLYRNQPALHEVDFDHTGFEWIDCHDFTNSTLVYLRRAKNPEDFLLVACNFTPVPRVAYRCGVPRGGWYQEIFNSDSSYYGGSNMGNGPGLTAAAVPSHHHPF